MARPTFWERFLRLNAPLVVGFLRQLADEVELLFPGQPELAFMFFNVGGKVMLNPTIPDNSGPITGTILWTDVEGNATTPAADEVPTISVDNDALGTATIADDKVTVTFAPSGQVGAVVITAQVTNDSGTQVTVQGTVTIQPSDLVAGTIDFNVAPPAPPAPTP